MNTKASLASEPLPDARLRVLMLGPALDVRGGVSTVESTLLDHFPPDIDVRHVATMAEGSKAYKLFKFAQASLRTIEHLENGIELVHLHFSSDASSVRKTLLARLALARDAKVIMHAHGACYREYWKGMTRATRAVTLGTLQRIDRLIVLGASWRDFFQSVGVPSDRISIVPNPVSIPEVPPTRARPPRVRIVFLGLIGPRKGAFDLVEAVALLSSECLDRLELVFAGNGETERLRALVHTKGLERSVEVRGWIEAQERDDLLASADALALPSYAEGLPMAVLEAMAWGLPPICTPVGSVTEYVKHEENGLLVEPGRLDQLASAIERILANEPERLEMGRRAKIAVEPLAPRLCAERIAAIYRSVTGRDASPASSAP